MRIDNNRVVSDFDNKKIQEPVQQKVEINKSFETELADGVKSDIKQGSITPMVEEIKSVNSALAHLSKVGGSVSKMSGDKMENAMADLRKITSSLKDILNNNLTAINEPGAATYSSDEIKSTLSNKNFATSHNFDYLASKADALLA